MPRRSWTVGSVVVLVAVSACRSAGAPVRSGRDAFAGVDCTKVRLPPEPELLAWEASARAQLDRMRRQGVVAVRYEAKGCEVSLELLPQCVGPKNRYVYVPLDATDTKLLRSTSELLEKMPVGAANVSGELSEKGALRADVKLVGSAGLKAGTTITEYDLVGPECRRATHVVSAVYLGGFALGAGDAARLASAKSLLSSREIESLVREGQYAICDRAAKEGLELDGCSTPLRLALLPLDGKGPAPVCPAAFVWDGTRCQRTAPPATSGTCSGPGCPVDADAGRPIFDQNAVERVARQHQAGVRRACWENMPETLRRVTVEVALRVDESGKVRQATGRVTDVEGPSDLASTVARCIGADVQSWQFPEPETEKAITLPFHLLRQ